MHAGFLHRRFENNFGLPVFVRHRIVVFDGYAAKGLALGCQTISKHAIVGSVSDSQQAHRSQEQSQNDSPEPRAGFVRLDYGHGLNYTRARTCLESEVLTILHIKTRPDSLELLRELATRRSTHTSIEKWKIMIRCSRKSERESCSCWGVFPGNVSSILAIEGAQLHVPYD